MPARRTRREKKQGARMSLPKFYAVYISVVAVAVFAIAGGLFYLRSALSDFEAGQPKYAVEPYERMFTSRDYGALMDLSGDSDLESCALYHAGGEVTVDEVHSDRDNQVKYQVRAGGEKVGGITLTRGGAGWSLEQLTLAQVKIVEPEPTPEPGNVYTVSILAPSDSVVTVDGAALTAEDVAEEGLYPEAKAHLPANVPCPTLVRYEISSDSSSPEVSAVSAGGQAHRITSDGEGSFTAELINDKGMQALHGERAIKTAQNFALFTSGDITKNKMLSCMVKDGPGYKTIKDYDNRWPVGHHSYKFFEPRAAYFVSYSEDCYSCEISYMFTMHTGEQQYLESPTRMTCYFVGNGDRWRMYDFVLGAEMLTDEDVRG